MEREESVLKQSKSFLKGEKSKTLIAFYSRADENYVNGSIKSLETGNTEIAANIISQLITNADVFKIEQDQPYSANYNQCTSQAKADQQSNARPKLKAFIDSIEEYDIIYLGFPNYWGTMPMAVFTFMEYYNFEGKIIKPFCTHEGSGMGKSEKDIKELCPTAIVKIGLAIRGGSAPKIKNDIEKWLKL